MPASDAVQYMYLCILIAFALAVAIGMVAASALLGPRRPEKTKAEAYECGIADVGLARQRMPARYILVAMLFIIFDVEVVFLIPWATTFRQLRLFGLIEVGVFIAVLLVGYFYMLGRRALEWEA